MKLFLLKEKVKRTIIPELSFFAYKHIKKSVQLPLKPDVSEQSLLGNPVQSLDFLEPYMRK